MCPPDSLTTLRILLDQQQYADALPRLLAAVAIADRSTRDYAYLCGMLGMCSWRLDQAVAHAQPWFEAAVAQPPPILPIMRWLARYSEPAATRTAYAIQLDQLERQQGHRPPNDPDDAAAWDRFWLRRRDDPHQRRHFGDSTSPLVAPLQARGSQTILCVGNGVDLEPRVLACAGFVVTALDLSPVATAAAADHPLLPTELATYLIGQQPTRTPQELASWIAQATPVTYVAGSFLDPTCCPGPYDVIVVRRTLQGVPDERMPEATERLLARLAPHGVLINHGHNYRPDQPAFLVAVQAHGVPVVSWRESFADALTRVPDQRVVWLTASSG